MDTEDDFDDFKEHYNSQSNAIDHFIFLSMIDENEDSTTDSQVKQRLRDRIKKSRYYKHFSDSRHLWRVYATEKLIEAEMKIFLKLSQRYNRKMVNIDKNNAQIWTVSSNTSSNNVPIVLIHGFAGGSALWSPILDQLCIDRPLYALDLPGFARSSRPMFSEDPCEIEKEYVIMFEQWRLATNINRRFILVGHSFGGFLSTLYAIEYSYNIEQLILVDSWGFSEKPDHVWHDPHFQRYPSWIRLFSRVITRHPPLAALRAFGPLGKSVMKRMCSNLLPKSDSNINDDCICEYLCYCNAETPTGERAFIKLSDHLAWAKNPLIERIDFLVDSVPLYFLHGSRSWIHTEPSKLISSRRNNTFMKIFENAGHHIYADVPEEFVMFLKSVLRNQEN